MNRDLIVKVAAALALAAGDKYDDISPEKKAAYERAALAACEVIFRQVVMPEYGRWRNMSDNEGIAIGAIGAAANIASKLLCCNVED